MALDQMKIHELPDAGMASDITADSIMIIQDSIDTKKISINVLKDLFSDKTLIERTKENIEDTISTTKENLKQSIEELSEKVIKLSSNISNITNSESNTIETLEALSKTVNGYSETISAIVSDSVERDKQIQNICDDMEGIVSIVDNVNKSSSEVVATVEKQESTINALTSVINELSSDLGNAILKIEQLENNTSDDIPKSIRTACEKVREDIMKYIDYYHHVTSNPPDFGESDNNHDGGNGNVSVSMNELIQTVYPVGAVMITSSTTDPSLLLPGTTWECVTGSEFISTDEDVQTSTESNTVYLYIWKRIS